MSSADERDRAIGLELAKALGLSVRPGTGRYVLGDGQGDKDAIMLARTVRRILEGPDPTGPTEPDPERESWADLAEGRLTAPPQVPPKELPAPKGEPLRCAGCGHSPETVGPLVYGEANIGRCEECAELPEEMENSKYPEGRTDAEIIDEIGGF